MTASGPSSPDDPFMPAWDKLESIVTDLKSPQAATMTHSELEDRITTDGRELLLALLQGHLDFRAANEADLEEVVGADGIERTRLERDHARTLATVVGEVSVKRRAYRAPQSPNLHPADATLSLPPARHSHGLRKLAAIESTRGSFEDATEAIGRVTGMSIGKRQVEQLAGYAAADVDDFYGSLEHNCRADTDVLVISADGKGIVMRPDSLREPTARSAARSDNKLATRLSRGEKRNRKRMAEVGTVYDITPVARTPADIIAADDNGQRSPGPIARGKWLTASVDKDTAAVIASVFDEAARRDPDNRRPWVALVDAKRPPDQPHRGRGSDPRGQGRHRGGLRARAGVLVESRMVLLR